MTSTAVPLPLSAPRENISVLARVLGFFLRTPLVLKILGANAIIAGVVFVLLGNGAAAAEEGAIVVIAAALAFAFAVNALLVRVALSPVRELERVAEAVSFGEFGSRAMPSLVADRQLAQLTDTVNRLLDSLAAERRRIQKLGAVVVSAQDMERARLSRELHDSIAQTIAAVRFQLSAAAAGTSDNAMSNRLSTARAMLGTVMDEVRNISNTLHPRVAEDLGLMRALDALAQRVEERGKLSVRIHSMLDDRPVSAKAATTLFRVAQEAVNEAETRTAASHAEIAVISNGGTVSLEVRDDRPPVDMESIQPDNTRSGALARILDRVELSGGVMRIERGASGGMRIIAEVDSSEDDS